MIGSTCVSDGSCGKQCCRKTSRENKGCSPATLLSVEDVEAARRLTELVVKKTPCELCSGLSREFKMNIYLKRENMQVTNSFKYRGAFYSLKKLQQETTSLHTVVTASAGNHAVSLTRVGRELGIRTVVVVPTNTSKTKINECIANGAEVVIFGQHMTESKKEAESIAQEKNYHYVSGYDDLYVLAGQGTIGLEILEQIPDVDAVLVQIGGGGLVSGIATAIKAHKPDCRIIGVESESCPSFSAAVKANRPVDVGFTNSVAHGMAISVCGTNALAVARDLIDYTVVVKEESIVRAVLKVIEHDKTVVEGAGAAGLAPIIEGLVPELAGKNVVVILTGGNLDTPELIQLLQEGLRLERGE